jgi:hypothetical protein
MSRRQSRLKDVETIMLPPSTSKAKAKARWLNVASEAFAQ